MLKSTFQVAKIVAGATEDAWCQAYHAGGLTAILSVRQKKNQTTTPLAIVGKDLLNTFESEYFTLEVKNLANIAKAVEVTYKKSSDTHDISLLVAACIQNALYIVLAGTGNIQLIRQKHVGTVLTKENAEDEKILAASGFLEAEDILILETLPFAKIIPTDMILETMKESSIEEAAETFTPQIHQAQEGAAAALFFAYKEEKNHQTLGDTPEKALEETPPQTMEEIPTVAPPEPATAGHMQIPSGKKKSFTHRQRLFLTIAIILLLLLIATIYFSLKKEQEAKQAALFKSIYQPALQQYQEGQGLVNLNVNQARTDFQQSIATLQNGKGKFTPGSSNEEQIATLLTKVQENLAQAADINTVTVQKIDSSNNSFLAFEAKQHIHMLAADDTNFYTADTNGVTRYNQKTNASKTIIHNTSDWKNLGGFGTYLGNFYILDTQGSIIKYVAGGTSFVKASYFAPGVNPDLSQSVSLAIDGSIWILTHDGTIMKFTKGKADTYSPNGLDKQFSSPTRIVTSIDDSNIYILDNGNNRLVVLSKTGSYVGQYQAQQLQQATDMTVDEKNKKVDLLVGNDVDELTLK